MIHRSGHISIRYRLQTKGIVTAALGAAAVLGLGLVLVRPVLLLVVLAGSALGATVAAVLARRRASGPPHMTLSKRVPLAALAGAATLAGAVLVLSQARDDVPEEAADVVIRPPDVSTDKNQKGPRLESERRDEAEGEEVEEERTSQAPPEPSSGERIPPLAHPNRRPPSRVAGKSVRTVRYEADLDYSESDGAWEGEERIRITPAMHAALTRWRPHAGNDASSPNGSAYLASGWRFQGRRGETEGIHVYMRQRKLPVDVPTWPPTGESTIEIEEILRPDLRAELVPRDGSLIELHAPANFVRETDPPAVRTDGFGNEDIVTVQLEGLEDDVDRRKVRVRVANGIARSSIYRGIENLSALTVILAFFGGVPAVVVGFFVNRQLKKRFPLPPSAEPST